MIHSICVADGEGEESIAGVRITRGNVLISVQLSIFV